MHRLLAREVESLAANRTEKEVEESSYDACPFLLPKKVVASNNIVSIEQDCYWDNSLV